MRKKGAGQGWVIGPRGSEDVKATSPGAKNKIAGLIQVDVQRGHSCPKMRPPLSGRQRWYLYAWTSDYSAILDAGGRPGEANFISLSVHWLMPIVTASERLRSGPRGPVSSFPC
jgi:hypothetical protein